MTEPAKVLRHPNSPVEHLVDAQAVANWLGVEANTVQKWASKRKIPHRKINGVVRYMMSEVVSWALEDCDRPVRGAGR